MRLKFEFTVGGSSLLGPSTWLDGRAAFDENSFEISADLCSRYSRDALIVNRLHLNHDRQLTAELLLAILSKIAIGPFTPTEGVLEIRANNLEEAESSSIWRILEPQVRSSGIIELEPKLAAKLSQKMSHALALRHLQERQLARLNVWNSETAVH